MGSLLPVVRVGSYLCSSAASLSDLRRVDSKEFTLSPSVEAVLSTQYRQGYGFLVCKLTSDGPQHPIAYVHDLPLKLFVPTFHEHGKKDKDTDDWDHVIYSCNTTIDAGPTADEMQTVYSQLLQEKEFQDWVKVTRATWTPTECLGQLPLLLVQPHVLRRLRRTGKHPNTDLVLHYQPSTEKIQSNMPVMPKGRTAYDQSVRTSSLAARYPLLELNSLPH